MVCCVPLKINNYLFFFHDASLLICSCVCVFFVCVCLFLLFVCFLFVCSSFFFLFLGGVVVVVFSIVSYYETIK